jgi:hypothetical protein
MAVKSGLSTLVKVDQVLQEPVEHQMVMVVSLLQFLSEMLASIPMKIH